MLRSSAEGRRGEERGASYLDQLLLQPEDGKTLPLLQDGQLRLPPVRHLIPAQGFSLPLGKVDGHGADAPHVGGDLSTFVWMEGTEM